MKILVKYQIGRDVLSNRIDYKLKFITSIPFTKPKW